jgi:O-antigen/teichoic acid export membrane protein
VGGGDRAAAEDVAARLIRMLILAIVPAAVVLALLSWILIPLAFGEDFRPAIVPFVLLLPGTICLTLWYVVSLFLVASLRRPGLTTLIQGVALLASIAPYYYAVHSWGTKGAAVVSSGVYVFVFAAGTVALLRLTDLTRRNLLPTGADVRLTWNVLRGGFALLPGRERRA